MRGKKRKNISPQHFKMKKDKDAVGWFTQRMRRWVQDTRRTSHTRQPLVPWQDQNETAGWHCHVKFSILKLRQGEKRPTPREHRLRYLCIKYHNICSTPSNSSRTNDIYMYIRMTTKQKKCHQQVLLATWVFHETIFILVIFYSCNYFL